MKAYKSMAKQSVAKTVVKTFSTVKHTALALSLSMSMAAIFTPQVSQAADVTLRYANFPPATTIPCIQMDMWVEAMDKLTQGRLAVQTFPAGTLLDAKAMLRGIATGQADIGCTSMLYYPGSFPLYELFGLPLSFTSAAEASYVVWEIFKAHTPKELSRYKILSMFSSGPSQVMSSKPLQSLADLQKITLRAAGSISDGLTAIGGNTVSLPMSETPEALQKGVVDGVCSSWDTLKDMNYAEDCAYGLVINMPVYPFAVFMNKNAWDRLPQDIRDIIDAYADEQVRRAGEYVDQAGATALAWGTAEHNFSLAHLNEADTQTINERVAPLIEAWKVRATDRGIDANAVLADVAKFRAQFAAMQ